MFYLVGLGLFDHKDISLKGLECLKNVDKIYAEFFTSRLFGSDFEAIEELIGKKIEVLVRNEVEEEHIFIEEAKNLDVALITGGDPLIATTHSEFLVQCSKNGIDYEVIHSSSILSSAPAISGLQGYKFGKVTTIPFPDYNFYPKSPYEAIEENLKMDLHTLVLLDIQAHKDRYMTVNQGLEYLLSIKNDLDREGLITEDTLAMGIARVGSSDVCIKAGSISQLAEYLVEIAGADPKILDDV